MTTEQVKQTEKISNTVVTENKKVYAKETSLSTAKMIQGVRAMFEETYPDPVRVVSIGKPVEELEADLLGNFGLQSSIEFCGGT